jgi:hypothetical protein
LKGRFGFVGHGAFLFVVTWWRGSASKCGASSSPRSDLSSLR